MPRELLPHFSPRLSDTGPNLEYLCDPLVKEKAIAFYFFQILLPLPKMYDTYPASFVLTPV